MSINLSKMFLTFSASILLVSASVMSSDARPHAKRQAPTQSEFSFYRSDDGSARDRDNSCSVPFPLCTGALKRRLSAVFDRALIVFGRGIFSTDPNTARATNTSAPDLQLWRVSPGGE